MGCEISGVMVNALKTIKKCSVGSYQVLANFMYHKVVDVGQHQQDII